MIRKYDGEFPARWSEEIFKYLSLPTNEFPIASRCFEVPIFDREYYDLLCDTFRSPHLWHFTDAGNWELRHQVSNIDGFDQQLVADSWEGNRIK